MSDETGRQENQGFSVYRDSSAALNAVLDEFRSRDHAWLFDLDQTARPTPVDWPSAAAVIEAEGGDLSIDAASFWSLDSALDKASDPRAAGSIRQVLQNWAGLNWAELEEEARATALERFQKASHPLEHGFQAVIKRWPRLRDDRELLSSAVCALERGVVRFHIAVPQLRHLHGDPAAAARVLATVTPTRSSFDERDELASLLAEWSGDTIWGQLQHALWRTETESSLSQTRIDELPKSVIETAALLQEFGLTIAHNPPYALAELSPESRLSWREDLARAVGQDVELRRAVTETLLRFASTRDDRAAIFAVLTLYPFNDLVALEHFRSHRDSLVRRRVAAALALATGTPDMTELLREARAPMYAVRPLNVGTIDHVRTWIGDARIERLIEEALNQSAHEFGDQVRSTRDSGEETHLPILFERLRNAFVHISGRLEMLAAETNANDRLQFKLEHRVVGKAEEGGVGVNAKRFSTDVCLLFEAREGGQRFARRASFLQGKRIHVRRGALEVDFYPVDAEQLRDLTAQTMASFLFLVGPTCDQVTMPVIPARLFLEMIERGQPATQIAPTMASRLGKSIGTWILEDVIGLWTGDWKEAVVRKAEGDEGREPYLLVSIIANRVRKGPDGWTT